MGRSRDRSYLWVLYTCAGLLFAGAVLRSPLVIDDDGVLLAVSLLLAAWLALFVSEAPIHRRWRVWPAVYLILQTVIVVALLALLPESQDFFALLFGALAMQAFLRYPPWIAAVCVALFIPLTAVPLVGSFDGGELGAVVFSYTALNLFLGAYALVTRRAVESRTANQALGLELQAANTELQEHTSRMERLAVAQERNRLARELHDSVTQTIFSMTLAGQSAAILLEREPAKVDEQLDRLSRLTQSALSEMHVLISELTPDVLVQGGLVAAIRRDIQRRAAEGPAVSLEVEEPPPGSPAGGQLSVAEEQGLLRIAQEALNNISKHSGAVEAAIRLCLRHPFTMEIEDQGLGFDVRRAKGGPGIGLASMSERAAEIGWGLEVESGEGRGTKVIVRRLQPEGGD